jgi:hypothetical protein
MSDKSQEYETKLRELRKKYDDEINSHKTVRIVITIDADQVWAQGYENINANWYR